MAGSRRSSSFCSWERCTLAGVIFSRGTIVFGSGQARPCEQSAGALRRCLSACASLVRLFTSPLYHQLTCRGYINHISLRRLLLHLTSYIQSSRLFIDHTLTYGPILMLTRLVTLRTLHFPLERLFIVRFSRGFHLK